MKCQNCGIEFEGRADAKFCSPNCRVTFNRKASIVTDNVTLSAPAVTDNFEYTAAIGPNDKEREVVGEKNKVRTARYWYEIPLSATPVLKRDWPKMPDYMNGRQYFLWWKNEFKEGSTGPIILDPLPQHENVKYVPMRTGMGV